MALQFHPDKNKETGAEDIFKEVAEAYEILKQEAAQIKFEDTATANTTNSRRYESNYRNADPTFRTFFDGNYEFREQYCDPKSFKQKSTSRKYKSKKERSGRVTNQSPFTSFNLKIGLIKTKYRPENQAIGRVYDLVFSSVSLKLTVATIIILLCLPL